jgi:integrase
MQEGLQHTEGSSALPNTHPKRSSSKKSPALGTVGQFCEAWKNGRPKSNHDYQAAKDTARLLGQLSPHQLTEPLIRSVMDTWKKRLGKRCIYCRRGALVRMFSSMDRAADTHAADLVPRVTKPGPRQNLVQDGELQQILKHAPLWFQCFLLLCRQLGLRHSEAKAIKPTNYNEEKGTLSFDRKGSGTSDLPVSEELAALIKVARASAPHEPILKTLGARGLSAPVISQMWSRLKKKAGADPTIIIHDLRRTIATSLYNRTKDLRACQQLLGHQHMTSTLTYIAPLDPEHLRELLGQLRPINLATMKPATETKQ